MNNITTSKDVLNGNCDTKEWKWAGGYTPAHGGSFAFIQCPFCDNKQKVYLWSFAGSGCKRCDMCGALLSVSNKAHKVKNKDAS